MSEEARRAELLRELESVYDSLRGAELRSQLAARADSILTPQQIRVVGLLALNGPMRSSQVAAALGVSRSTMTGLLDRLENGGLVVRAVDPADARGRTAEATERGRQALSELLRTKMVAPDRVVRRLNVEELEGLLTGFRAVLREVRALAESGADAV
ncbi:MAG: MarR family transcriptional regulator [Bifidobacteriaceae bacterium]|nr:MarR family transcriptional regulator [Bifidobacteriaceae bacterium]